MKLKLVVDPRTGAVLSFLLWCPACGGPHMIPGGMPWNGDRNQPSFDLGFSHADFIFTPGQCGRAQEYRRCAFLIREGLISYLAQSNHAMAGETKKLPHWPESIPDG